MKNIYLLFLVLFLAYSVDAQIINIPDARLKSMLIWANSSGVDAIAKNLTGQYMVIDVNHDLEISIAEASLVSYLFLDNTSHPEALIASLEGLQYFPNLKTLYCGSNNLTTIDSVIAGLPHLEELRCDANHITTLDASAVPTLKRLYTTGNGMTSLNVSGLSQLEHLECGYNQIADIDLWTLSSLSYFDGGSNLFTNLDFPSNDNLTLVICNICNLQSLTFGNCPNLETLKCFSNQLTTLDVTSLINIHFLDCANNQIAVLDFSHHASYLQTLNCQNNLLTALELPYAVGQATSVIYCNNNLLTTLDVSNARLLSRFDCSNNPLLTYFNIKTGRAMSLSYPFLFENNPSLRYICSNDYDANYMAQKIIDYGYTNCHVNTYCSFVPGGAYYVANGTFKLDADSNGCGASDPVYPGLKLGISSNSFTGITIADTSGNYAIPFSDQSTYTITPILENPSYFTVTPATTTGSFVTQTSPATQNFCIAPNGIHNDLEVAIIPMQAARPGNDTTYKIIYRNVGTHVQSGNINLNFDDSRMDLVTALPGITGQTTNQLNWNFSNLQPAEKRVIEVMFNINSPVETPPVIGGTIFNFTATVVGAIDETPVNNTSLLTVTVVNSFDPNDKTCLEGATITPEMAGKYVHYLIRFENTGTFPAENIVVKDMIDTAKFDVNSLVPIDASHPFVTKISNSNKVEFIFENIQLPFDDASNDGYVTFKIKTQPNLTLGDTFSNSASIYFDYNFPIVTNTATTAVAFLANQDFDFADYFKIYPNPTNAILNIESAKNIEVKSIGIYNTLGQILMVIPNAQQTKAIDVSSLKTGNYFLKINAGKGSTVAKFIKR